MDNIRSTEWMVVIVALAHVIAAPGTKVEESFNVQATHDILFHRFNVSAYDHLQFPGVVPRTFIGPLAISAVLLPFVEAFQWFSVPKYWSLFAVRMVLATAVLINFCNFCRCVGKHYGKETADFLRFITATQFHFLFYASRPLPNTFALIGVLRVYQLWMDGYYPKAVRVATVFSTLFRCELILLFGPIFILPLISRKLPLFGKKGAISNGLYALSLTLLITVPIDSFMWGRWLWPEGEVWWFNVFLNKSHEYGVLPFSWYIYSAIPRGLLATLFFSMLGLIKETRFVRFVMPALVFIFLYSLLPHKELRFIIYSFPLLNLPAAALCGRLWKKRWDSLLHSLLAVGVIVHLALNVVGTAMFIYAAVRNYPGSEGLGYLQFMQRFDRNKPISVYIDNYAAQTGVSRFLQLYDSWEYNKTEKLEPSDLTRFNFLLIGSYKENNLVAVAQKNFTSHRIIFVVRAFARFDVKKSSQFPYLYPSYKFKDRLVVMKKLDE